ncbi:MAG: phosphoribosyltransferase family protein [Chloroflexota bacterium]
MPHGIVRLEWCAAFGGRFRHRRPPCPQVSGRAATPGTGPRTGDGRPLAPGPAAAARSWCRCRVHPTRRRERGFDRAEDLAAAVAAELGLPWSPALERRTRTIAQRSLGRVSEQAANLEGAFGVRAERRGLVLGRWVILVDDVSTTGATLSECAVALRAAGARAVSALTVARDR